MARKTKWAKERQRINDAIQEIIGMMRKGPFHMNHYRAEVTHGYQTTISGKRTYFVGYTWTRQYAHHLTGLCNLRVLGRGKDADEALAKALKRHCV